MRKNIASISLAVALLLVSILMSNAVAGPFYEGKTLRVICTSKPGGGYDAYARLLTRTMKKYLPGAAIIVENAIAVWIFQTARRQEDREGFCTEAYCPSHVRGHIDRFVDWRIRFRGSSLVSSPSPADVRCDECGGVVTDCY